MQGNIALAMLGAAVTSACTIPTTPLSNTITTPFRVQVQNASNPVVHNKFMNLLEAGGGDKHLYIGNVGTPTSNLVLTAGVIEQGAIHAVIGGEHSNIDNTDKMFMTERGDNKAIFQPTYACNPESDALQIELRFVRWENHDDGQWICVRPTFDDAYEFRYYPPGDTASDPNKFCVKVTLVAAGAVSSSSSTLSSTTIRTSSGSSNTGPTSSALPVSTNGKCGTANNRATCAGSTFGKCCSVKGNCGDSAAFCAVGNMCQPGFGACYPTSTDGKCGAASSRSASCSGSSFGSCCSVKGNCGSTDAFCKTSNKCQAHFGTCT